MNGNRVASRISVELSGVTELIQSGYNISDAAELSMGMVVEKRSSIR